MLDPGLRAGRAREVRLLLEARTHWEETATGIRVWLSGSREIEARLRLLIELERACCPFLEFRLEPTGAELELEVSAPPPARPLIEELLGLTRAV